MRTAYHHIDRPSSGTPAMPNLTTTKATTMKIADIRNTIDTLNWARKYNTGGTNSENRRNDLPAQLAPHIAAVTALEIPKRFAADITRQAEALEYAQTVIARWEESQSEVIA
jgi:hypothetical protein